jgi:hypothetical protein
MLIQWCITEKEVLKEFLFERQTWENKFLCKILGIGMAKKLGTS